MHLLLDVLADILKEQEAEEKLKSEELPLADSAGGGGGIGGGNREMKSRDEQQENLSCILGIDLRRHCRAVQLRSFSFDNSGASSSRASSTSRRARGGDLDGGGERTVVWLVDRN